MKESVTYQAIVEEGRVIGEARGQTDEARRILLKLGSERFGEPGAKVKARLNKIADKNLLEDLVMRTMIVSNWNDLLKKA